VPRKQVILDERHERFLKEAAAEQGVSEGQLVRRALDLLMSGGASATEDQAQRRARADDLVDAFRRAAATARPTASVRWSREEIYADRESR
jgi:hypothetical protein